MKFPRSKATLAPPRVVVSPSPLLTFRPAGTAGARCVIDGNRGASVQHKTSLRTSCHRQQIRSFTSNSSRANPPPNTEIKPTATIKPTNTSDTEPEKHSVENAGATTEDDMSQKLIPSNPADVMVIRNVTPNIATFSVPFSRFGTAKIGGRGTLVKLTNGSLAVFSPVALTEEAKLKVTEMGGDVQYIIALDYEHHIFLSEWSKAYPQAKLIGPEGLQQKRHKMNDDKVGKEEFFLEFKKHNKRDTKIDAAFDQDFTYEYVDGHANLELVFLYKPEKVLIEADLLFNLPAKEQYSKVPDHEKQEGTLGKMFSGVQSVEGDAKWMKRLNWYVVSKDRESMNDSLKVINAWDFNTIIPCHGDVIEGNGKEIFQKIFSWHLEGKK